jgi:glucose-1-phosphate adenylyltransferase
MEHIDTRNAIGVILGGGRGTRLSPLTLYRSKPAVPIGGKYRLIDIPISNCLHSHINKIFVLTQFNSASLHRHISTTYRFDNFTDGSVEILAAEQTQDSSSWFQGTADAVRQQLRHILSKKADQILILSGDHLYRMDYRQFLISHWARNADVSIAVKPVTRKEAPELGILKVNYDRRIIDFCEKPQTDAELDELRLDKSPSDNPEEVYLASMGIYLFEPQVLVSLLMGDDRDDFGKHIIPAAISKLGVYAHPFDGYWEDIGTIRSFYDTNLALTDLKPVFNFYQHNAPIYTHARNLAPALVEGCLVREAIISEGARVRGELVERSIIGVRSMIGTGAKVRNTVMMGADFYEEEADLERNHSQGQPDIGIGPDADIDGAIIDKNARIGRGVVIRNEAQVQEREEKNYSIRDGIVVVPKDAVIEAGTVI